MIVLFNPLSTTPGKQPLPLSILSLAAVLEGRHDWTLVDGNVCPTPSRDIVERLDKNGSRRSLLAVTVMPGPQLTQAVEVCRKVRESRPDTPIVWGGYFPTQHADTVLKSAFVDFVVRSQGETPLLELVAALAGDGDPSKVSGLSWKLPNGQIIHNPVGTMTPLDDLPELPYHRVEMDDYIHPTYLGSRTVAHNSSFGCPFSCNFCAVVAMTNRRWLAESPERTSRAVGRLVRNYHVDAVQMHDMDFFINEPRVHEIAERLTPLGIHWWALGRVDILMGYSDATWKGMAGSGLKMVYSGVESASDAVLKTMNKGGQVSARLALDLARRTRDHGIVPEFSFVLGTPPDPEGDMANTFEFIRRIKKVNPATEVVLYTYTPVPMDGTLYSEASRQGFAFPKTLEEWASDAWRQLSLRRGDGLPWLDQRIRSRVRDFERVLNAFYPTVTDRRLTPARRALLKTISGWRFALRWYRAPYELQALQRLMHYQRPETTGF
jgi:radical SAM superfamily enzyme YgiQ (UPF0313 family)